MFLLTKKEWSEPVRREAQKVANQLLFQLTLCSILRGQVLIISISWKETLHFQGSGDPAAERSDILRFSLIIAFH